MEEKTPLYEQHLASGGKMVPFAGYLLPVQYTGVIEEHMAVRTAAGVFDVSHLGKATVTGPGAAAFVNDCLSNDLNRIGPGQAQYTLCCTGDGGVLDDLIDHELTLPAGDIELTGLLEQLRRLAHRQRTLSNGRGQG